MTLQGKGEEPAAALDRFIAACNGRVLLVAESAGRREALLELLAVSGRRPPVVESWPAFATATMPLAITVAPLAQGFALTSPALTVLTERELFGERVRQQRRRRRGAARDPETLVRDLSELALGAPVVHLDHGVGRYRGLVTLDVGGAAGEFLALEYAKGDKLYVPVAQLALISRYAGAAPELAPLHQLGGEAWERAKRRAAEKVRDIAAELLAIYAQREARPGVATAIERTLYAAVRRHLPVRGNARPGQRDRSRAGRSGQAAADGSRGLRRRRFRQDRGRVARGVCGRHRRPPGCGAGADHPAGAAALPELPRPLRRLADPRRGAVALQGPQGSRRYSRQARRRRGRRDHRHAPAAAGRRELKRSRPA